MVVFICVLVVVGVVVLLWTTRTSRRQVAEADRPAGSAGPPTAGPVVPASDDPLSAADVRNVAFTKPKVGGGRGYDEDEVDDFLDRVEAELRQLESERDALVSANASSTPAPPAPNRKRLTQDDVIRVRFTRPVIGKRGYHSPDVDLFLERIGEGIGRRNSELAELRRRNAAASGVEGDPAQEAVDRPGGGGDVPGSE